MRRTTQINLTHPARVWKHNEAKLTMVDQTSRAKHNKGTSNNDFRLKYVVDVGFLSVPHPNNTPNTFALDDEELGRAPSSDDSKSCESAGMLL